MTIIKKTKDNKYWQGSEKSESLHTVDELHINTAIVENRVESPPKIKNRTAISPRNLHQKKQNQGVQATSVLPCLSRRSSQQPLST